VSKATTENRDEEKEEKKNYIFYIDI